MSNSKSSSKRFRLGFGTSPHGLSAELCRTHQESREAAIPHSLVDGVGFADASDGGAPCAADEARQSSRRPEIYRSQSIRIACRRIKEAAAMLFKGTHTLRLDDAEFLHLVSAIERERNRMRKAIGKGLAEFGDLRATDTLWQKLQVLRAVRMRGAR